MDNNEGGSCHDDESCKKDQNIKMNLVESCGAEDKYCKKSPSPMLRECDICGKTFNSGKALGGHRRSHFQKQQKKVKVRFTSKSGDSSIRANCDYDDDDGKRVCCICKKEFPTKNSLFGHMRSHPERSWRGVSPPSDKHFSSPSSCSFSSVNSDSLGKNKDEYDDDDEDDYVEDGNRVFALDEYDTDSDVTDLSQFTSPSWGKKDVRGRNCIGGYEAAETLAYLSAYSRYFGGGSTRVFPKRDEVLPMSAAPLIKLGKRKIGESSSSKKNEVKKIKFYLKGELKIGNKGVGTSECGDEEGNKKGILCMNDEEEDVDVDEGFYDVNAEVMTPVKVQVQEHVGEKKVKKIDHKGKGGKKNVVKSRAKNTEYENGNNQEKVGGYKCGACGKVFSTFQGLGGHRSIHKEKNINIATTIDESTLSEAVAEENNSSSSSNMNKVDEATPNEAAALPEAAAASDEASQSGAKRLDFDLNELPCVMDD
ncbi:hypothetical protein VNO78_12349 [Psophocarpus tetragonolobus]|uniref:C2H2-type domain-containing protein n=1 Tax=Psophocarpus tetragonolobus TaxID=3891 RepID=A0AAN9SN74_PSOTE